MNYRTLCFFLLVGCLKTALAASPANTPTSPNSTAWNPVAAAHYLDSREVWWQSWPPARRDHETVCVSCHTVLPYALSRPGLDKRLGEHTETAPEQIMLKNVTKRVTLWKQVQPFYLDAQSGPGKSSESRATESVVNALVLSSHDAQTGHLTELTRTAFDNAWALQLKSGPAAGAWKWQVFHLAPWESSESQYQGATFLALAVGLAPDGYQNDPKIQRNLQLLCSYLQREYSSQPLENRIVLLWASSRMPRLLTAVQRASVVAYALSRQQPDGGWSLADLGTYRRHDGTPVESVSDGYATGLVVLALESVGVSPREPQLRKGLKWLVANQSKKDGSWRASSLNKKRDPNTDVGRFMSDAATGYAVLALQKSH